MFKSARLHIAYYQVDHPYPYIVQYGFYSYGIRKFRTEDEAKGYLVRLIFVLSQADFHPHAPILGRIDLAALQLDRIDFAQVSHD